MFLFSDLDGIITGKECIMFYLQCVLKKAAAHSVQRTCHLTQFLKSPDLETERIMRIPPDPQFYTLDDDRTSSTHMKAIIHILSSMYQYKLNFLERNEVYMFVFGFVIPI